MDANLAVTRLSLFNFAFRVLEYIVLRIYLKVLLNCTSEKNHMSKFVDYGESWWLYGSVVFWILMQVVYTPHLYFSCVVFIQGVRMSTALSYIFLGGAVCNKCLFKNVMLCSVHTEWEQWCDNFKKKGTLYNYDIITLARTKEWSTTTGCTVY
jgi:hypothetical protein